MSAECINILLRERAKMPLPDPYYSTSYGAAYFGDAFDLAKHLKDESVDLIVTSPPFGLRRKF